ncbi:prepilin-type N-terminal cleavage/methylation domain-containing protein [Pseudomonas sp. F1_0610]|uniref:type IV pilus modification PilV family protein n=1 Tax=Pseudomonas sp. F1_0610 TaxID=3114284 RepID=UPI0039C1C4D9
MSIKGFSLIEILISLVLITVGLLGLQVMQARSTGYILENNKYNAAIELTNDFVDLVKSYRQEVYQNTIPTSLYYKGLTSNNVFWSNGKITNTGSCNISNQSSVSGKIACWNERANNIGISSTKVELVAGRDILIVTLFWDPVTNSNGDFSCYSESNKSKKCSYTARFEI